jgi:hypothetical protein
MGRALSLWAMGTQRGGAREVQTLVPIAGQHGVVSSKLD